MQKGSLGSYSYDGGYEKIFEVEIQSWCYAFGRFPGEFSSELVYAAIREMAPLFETAITKSYVFDLRDVADRIHKAVQGVISAKEITFVILANLPAPYGMDEDSQFALAQIIDQAESSYGPVLEDLEWRWKKRRGIQVEKKKNPVHQETREIA